MNNKDILDNAPEGATHYMGEDCFFPFIKLISGVSHAYNFKVCEWLKLEKIPLSIDSRSLADIKHIVELEQVEPAMDRLMEEKRKRIAELERIVECVAHIGVDFGYGQYSIDQETIEKSRELTTKGGAE
jgi:hypothetical protein